MSARRAFEFVGDDSLDGAIVGAVMLRLEGAAKRETDAELLARLGLGGDDDSMAFEARWGD